MQAADNPFAALVGQVSTAAPAETPRRRRSNCIDLTGRRFGLLTALYITGNVPSGGTLWQCVCECGRQREVTGTNLRSGNTASCGCAGRRKRGEGRRDWSAVRRAA
jgi:hypothetical protein